MMCTTSCPIRKHFLTALLPRAWQVVQGTLGNPVASLANGSSFPLLAASPSDGCAALLNTGSGSVAGAVVLLQRGGCLFEDKVKAAQAAGAGMGRSLLSLFQCYP